MGNESDPAELERRLLEVYPEAQPLVEIIKRFDGMREVSISTFPHGVLAVYGAQIPEEGPFWTLLKDDSNCYFFHVMSFGLNPDILSISFRRQHFMSVSGKTYKGEAPREFLRANMGPLCQLYEAWFVKHTNSFT